jgi:hypothetical protein
MQLVKEIKSNQETLFADLEKVHVFEKSAGERAGGALYAPPRLNCETPPRCMSDT